MESSANDTFGHQQAGNPNPGGGPGAAAADPGFSRDTSSDAPGMAERARSAASGAGETLADAGHALRDTAGSLKATIADALASGAERLRQQGSGSGQLAGAAAGSATGGADTIADDNRLTQTSNQLAGGMQGAADWLREADFDGVKAGIERQVKEHPARSLAVAVGIGYLLGKAFRK